MYARGIHRVVIMFVLIVSSFAAPSVALAAETFYKVVVGSGPADSERLKMFYSRLMAELKVSDLGDANIGCDYCETLGEGLPEDAVGLTFALDRDGVHLPAFMLSYHAVQTSEHAVDPFALVIDGKAPPAAVCPNPLPPSCAPRAICIQTSSCDKPWGGTCAKCVP